MGNSDSVAAKVGSPYKKDGNEVTILTSLDPKTFDPAGFLASAGLGRRIIELKPKQTFFCQGDAADSVFYLQKGRARLTVVSENGKEATITLLSATDFVGEESLAAIVGLHLATATAVNSCTALKIGREEMIRVMHDEPAFAEIFLKFLLVRSMRIQADLVDQLFNSSEKRLARILLLMAEFGKPGEPETFIPQITQQTLADMIGTTRSRVSFFMNRFRKLGFISYSGRIQVHKSLLNVVLLDQLPEHNAKKPPIPFPRKVLKSAAKTVKTTMRKPTRRLRSA
ncbi:MAG TPA: Crp/Fnr family transcriptional regulator [Terracidiphilus sp.]|nr:Crp/Fnr family transcriptional regulator [Terracidiphilus sp.]